MQRTVTIVFVFLFGGLVAPSANAQWAVVDVGAIAQLIQQIAKMEQQLTTMQAHLRQAEQEYQSITGDRGMENLLSGTVRNYLPPIGRRCRPQSPRRAVATRRSPRRPRAPSIATPS
jgi:hypothetical protein